MYIHDSTAHSSSLFAIPFCFEKFKQTGHGKENVDKQQQAQKKITNKTQNIYLICISNKIMNILFRGWRIPGQPIWMQIVEHFENIN